MLAEGLIQEDGLCQYQYQRDPFFGWLLLQKTPQGHWTRVLGFTQEPQIDQDFVTTLFYFEKSPGSNMNQFPGCPDTPPRRSWPFAGIVLQTEAPGQVLSARSLSPEEELQVIHDVFHLDTSGLPLDP